jgi:hypothetical protein
MKRLPFKVCNFCKELTFFKMQVHEALTFYTYAFIMFYIMSRVHLFSAACCLTMIADFKGRRRKQERLRKKEDFLGEESKYFESKIKHLCKFQIVHTW